ncbi:hypothetical protein CHK_1633 [Christensenella hongkongensis]|uniref:Uncharacterized protein n=1 Tax=Christensenella hongkongensis TaxID=270498 RepID=A0A0M2NEF4_9FIRM|nr:hypothetical protein CHK_1633 [Christensenella hongkongensis]
MGNTIQNEKPAGRMRQPKWLFLSRRPVFVYSAWFSIFSLD